MSELSRQARRAMRAKVHRLTKGESGKVDASDYGPEEVLNAGVKTGLRPISRRAFKRGGKVLAAEGEKPRQNAGKKPRHLTVDALINRNVKDANEDREGIKHVGGMKRGGRTEKMGGGPLSGDATSAYSGDLLGMKNVGKGKTLLKKGGRACKESGGSLGAMVGKMANKMAEKTRDRRAEQQNAKDYRDILGSDTDIVERGNRTPYEPMPRKSGGKADFEGSAKDEAQDKKLAKKYGMSMKQWEASEKDAKHDKQESMKGLKKGGRIGKARGGDLSGLEFKRGGSVSDGELQGTRPTGGRLARKSGGRASKGKVNVNIVIASGRGQQQPMGGMPPGMPPGGPAGIPVPVPPPPGAGGPAAGPPMPIPMPMPMPAGGPPGGPPMPPGMPMGRKRGGRVYRSYKDMDAGAGSGLGRLEKTEIQKHKK